MKYGTFVQLVLMTTLVTAHGAGHAEKFANHKCPLDSFTAENFSRIQEGMTAAEVSEIFLCHPARHLTVRKAYAVQLYWTTIGDQLKWVQIWFDKEGDKVTRIRPLFEFKDKTGF